MRHISIIIAVCFLAGCAAPQPPHPLPTNSLAFHLQSLGRTPTKDEREVIEVALPLMEQHVCRTDYPLRSLKYDDTEKEWVLLFDSGMVDGAFWVYLRDKRATSFETHFAGTTWRTRFPTERKER